MTKQYYIMNELLKLGMTANTKGFKYILSAIDMAEKDIDSGMIQLTVLYNNLSKLYSKSPSNIERAIRCCIEKTWRVGNLEYINSIFRNSVNPLKGKPTNAEFIAMMSYHTRMKYKNEVEC